MTIIPDVEMFVNNLIEKKTKTFPFSDNLYIFIDSYRFNRRMALLRTSFT